jgi:hypothetical protein
MAVAAAKPEIIDEDTPSTRKRGTLPEREMAEIVTDESPAAGGRAAQQPSAEDAVAAARKATEDANRRASEADARAQSERNARIAAETAARRGSLTERHQAVKSRLEAAQGARDTALASLRAARTNDDFEAEAQAIAALSSAASDEGRYKAELEYIESATRGGGDGRAAGAGSEGGRQQAGGYDPGADDTPPAEAAWVRGHPLFLSDPRYRAAVVAAANEAIGLGMMRGSPSYLDHIDSLMTDRFGEGHGVTETHGTNGSGRAGGNGQDSASGRRSMAMPRSGADGGNTEGAAGSRVVKTPFGPITVERGPEGKPRLRIPPSVKQQLEDGASMMQHADGTPWSLAEYAMEQVEIAEEGRQRGDGSLSYESDQVYR